jgi:hypothetical protein
LDLDRVKLFSDYKKEAKTDSREGRIELGKSSISHCFLETSNRHYYDPSTSPEDAIHVHKHHWSHFVDPPPPIPLPSIPVDEGSQ